jgi:hypothetical protein
MIGLSMKFASVDQRIEEIEDFHRFWMIRTWCEPVGVESAS